MISIQAAPATSLAQLPAAACGRSKDPDEQMRANNLMSCANCPCQRMFLPQLSSCVERFKLPCIMSQGDASDATKKLTRLQMKIWPLLHGYLSCSIVTQRLATCFANPQSELVCIAWHRSLQQSSPNYFPVFQSALIPH